MWVSESTAAVIWQKIMSIISVDILIYILISLQNALLLYTAYFNLIKHINNLLDWTYKKGLKEKVYD